MKNDSEFQARYESLLERAFGEQRIHKRGKSPKQMYRLMGYFLQEGRAVSDQCVASSTLLSHVKMHCSGGQSGGVITRDNLRGKLNEINDRIDECGGGDELVFVLCEDYVVLLTQPDIVKHVREAKDNREAVARLFGALDRGMLANTTFCAELAGVPRHGTKRSSSDAEATAGGLTKSKSSVVEARARMADSPFSLEALMAEAKSELFIVGLNLYYLATEPELRFQLERWLQQGRERVLKLLLTDPTARTVCSHWNKLWPDFNKHLQHSRLNLPIWRQKVIETIGTGRAKPPLVIKVSSVNSVGLRVVDGDIQDATLVVTPYVPGEGESGLRPHFVVKKQEHPDIFAYYYHPYRTLFRDAPPLPAVRASIVNPPRM